MALLTLENLSFSYPGQTEKALDAISLQIHAGDFVVLCGQSGCGKTTLLRLLKPELAPHGIQTGTVLFCDKPLSAYTTRQSAAQIGYVLQSPEAQIVTDKVWHELAFGLENLGCPSDEIRLRVGEMASFFGIGDWFTQATATLSGGQKQLLNLASVMLLSPKLLLLDEPTSQLDPIAAADFINTLYRLNRELGITVLLSEHRLEEVLPLADQVLVLEKGKLLSSSPPRAACETLATHPIAAGFPAAARIYAGLPRRGTCPLTVKEGQEFLSGYAKQERPLPEEPEILPEEIAFSLKNVWFRYERNAPDILRGATLTCRRGELFALLGGNGAGKTTLLKVLAGMEKPYRGKSVLFGKPLASYPKTELHRHNVALLPQDVRTVFLKKTVQEDLEDLCRVLGMTKEKTAQTMERVSETFGISALLQRHPYDLSGGEMQKCALSKILLTEPRLLLLDEPTKGIDAYEKRNLCTLLASLCRTGMTILLVTHDVEFAAMCADRCALFFHGEVLSPSCPRRFFSSNTFYTTAACRIARKVFLHAVTVEDVIAMGKEQKQNECTKL